MGIYEYGKYIEVHPTFLYESLLTLFIFLFLTYKSNKRKYKGEITLIYLMIYSFGRMLIEGLRTDSLMIGNFRISQILSFIIFIATIFTFFLKERNQKKLENT